MINFKVDEEKCINCGMCSAECPVFIIDSRTEFPTIMEGKEANCLKCQHCLAVCPQGAISIWDMNPEESIVVSNEIPAVSEMENLIKTRRSIRRFRPEEIDKEFIHNLISTASYAPTARNDNAVQFTVVDNKVAMAKLREFTYNRIKYAFEEDRIPPEKLYYTTFQNMWETQQVDVIFRNAPHLLITSAPKGSSAPFADCCIAMSYFELLANSSEIGTLWNGFARNAFEELVPELKQVLGIPDDHQVAAVLLFGKSAVKFARSIQNDNPKIKTVYL